MSLFAKLGIRKAKKIAEDLSETNTDESAPIESTSFNSEHTNRRHDHENRRHKRKGPRQRFCATG